MSSELNIYEVPLTDVQMVEAAAGTGKTFNITALVARHVVEEGKTIDQILVVTFTNAATRELKDRIAGRLRGLLATLKGELSEDAQDEFLKEYSNICENKTQAIERLERAVRDIDLAAIYTIHGFCQQVLQEYIFEINTRFDAEFAESDDEIRLEVLDELWHGYIRDWHKDSMKKPLLSLIRSYSGPDAFMNDIKVLLSKPYIEMYGKEECGQLIELWDTLVDLHQGLKEHYDEKAFNIEFKSAGINRKKFSDDRVDGFLECLKNLVLSDEAVIQPDGGFSALEKFTISNVQNSYKKNVSLQLKPHFFEILEQYIVTAKSIRNAFRFTVIQAFLERYKERKQQLKIRNFDDILQNLHEVLTNKTNNSQNLKQKLRAQYPVALIDEFQDTDPIQYEIFESLYMENGRENLNLFLIGDPKQSIYRFRGADIHTYLKARDAAQNIWTLSTNYRSADNLVQGINALITAGDEENPFLQKLEFIPATAHQKDNALEISSDSIRPEALQFLKTQSDDELNKYEAKDEIWNLVAAEIVRLLQASDRGEILIRKKEDKSEPLQARDITILVRGKNDGEALKTVLQQRGIQSAMQSNAGVFKSDEFQDMRLLISAMREPGNAGLIRSVLCSRIGGLHVSELLQADENESNWLDILEHIRNIHQVFEKKGFMPAFRLFLHTPISVSEEITITPVSHIIALRNGDRIYTNLYHLAELINTYGRAGNRSFEDILKWMEFRRCEDEKNEAHELRLESDENLVKIMTIHASKGLQFPVVFCPTLWECREVTKKDTFFWGEEHKSWVDFFCADDNKPKHEREELAESLRLAYVAVTRAQYRCYLGWSKYSKQQQGALSGWLLGTEILQASKNKAIFQDINSAMEKLAENKTAGITEYEDIPWDRYQPSDARENVPLSARTFGRGKVLPDWFETSYSTLKRLGKESIEDEIDDEGYSDISESEEIIEETVHRKDSYGFPRGAEAGTFMHKIFEEIDFTWPESRIRQEVDQLIQVTPYSDDWHRKVMHEIILHTIRKNLGNEISLKKIKPVKCLKEMEFYLKATRADFDELMQIIGGKSNVNGINSISAFVKGFVDLIFESGGRYYILDYKSDYLGTRPDDYTPDVLERHIEDHSYNLQYHIYTVALKRYLESRDADFDFSRDFGGVYYLFLRADKENSGVYFTRPDDAVIEELERYFALM